MNEAIIIAVVHQEYGDEGDDGEYDFSAGCKTGDGNLPEVPDDNGHVAVEGSANEHEDSGHQKIALKSFCLCVSLTKGKCKRIIVFHCFIIYMSWLFDYRIGKKVTHVVKYKRWLQHQNNTKHHHDNCNNLKKDFM